LTFELFEGITPFENSNIFKQQNAIRNEPARFARNTDLSAECLDFINCLLAKNKSERLGAGGIEEVKAHPWLAEVKWEELTNKTTEPPFDP
jgi:serine/threonine protein kinase